MKYPDLPTGVFEFKNRWRIYLVITAFVVSCTFIQGSNAATPQEELRNLQEIKSSLYEKIAPGIVSVHVVHNGLPEWFLSTLEKFSNDLVFQAWQSGSISEQDAEWWRAWNDSLASHFERTFSSDSKIELPGKDESWGMLLREVFQRWCEGEPAGSKEEPDIFKKYCDHLKIKLENLSQKLEEIQVSKQPVLMVRQATGFLVDKGLVVAPQDLVSPRSPQERIRVWSERLISYSTGEMIARDIQTNVALIRLSTPGIDLTPTIVMDQQVEPKIGHYVLAFWHAFNQPVSMRSGEITGVRRILPFFHCASFIETSLPTSPGTLGGPLVDLEGRLVGMGTVFMGQGSMSEITFALPSDQLLRVVDLLKQEGNIQRGRLGVLLAEVPGDATKERMVVVKDVETGSPASRCGIQAGDIIQSLNGKPIDCRSTLIASLSTLKVNDKIQIVLKRQGKILTLESILEPYQETTGVGR